MLITADGSLQRINRAGLDMIEKDFFDQGDGQNIYPLVSEEYHEAFHDLIDAVFNGESQRLEYKLIGLKGQLRWLYSHAVPLRDEAGAIVSALVVSVDITERKQTEAALQQSENMLQAIIDNEPECVKLLDAEAKVIMMNRAGLKMIEADSLAQVKGQCVCPLIVPGDLGAFMNLTKQIFQGESGILAFEIVGLKGRRRWLETHAVPFRNEKGEIVALLGITRNITEQRQAEEALFKSRERFRALYNETPILLHSVDRNGKLVDVNNHWLRIMGYEREEVLGRKVTDFYTEASRQYAEQVVQPAFFRDGFCSDVPFQWIKKNGEVIDIIISATGERDAEGKVILSRSVVKDVTQQKQSEEKIRKSEQLIRSIIDSVDEGFILLDREFSILSANKSYCRQFGVTEEEIIGKHCYEVSHQNALPCCYANNETCAINKVFQTGTPFTSIHIHKDRNGSTRHIEFRGFPLINDTGEVTTAIEVIHDVTDRYRLEAEQLKIKKLEATAFLAGGIAHDYNNLLTVILGNVELAEEEAVAGSSQAKALNEATKATLRATALTNKFITFSSGGSPVTKTISPQEFIRDTANIALSGSNIQCDFSIAQDLRMVEIDPGQISQAIGNIVTNAREAMPQGGTIRLRAHNMNGKQLNHEAGLKLQGDFFIKITVADHGKGIPKKNLANIFDPYFSTKERGVEKGMGLGLTIANSIIKKHGGHIKVESEEGKGATVSIYLPAVQLNEIEVCQVADKVAVEYLIPPREKKTTKILFMDDEKTLRDMTQKMLKLFGYEQVEVAPHGEAVIEMFALAQEKSQPFDLLLLDLTIKGGMGGEETIKRLLEMNPEVRAIVCSGYSNDPILANYAAYGFIGVLAKPFRQNELNNAITQALDKK